MTIGEVSILVVLPVLTAFLVLLYLEFQHFRLYHQNETQQITNKLSDFEGRFETINERLDSIHRTFGQIQSYHKDTRDFYEKLRTLLRVHSERGKIGEIALEEIIKDQLPKEMYKIREKLGNSNIIPDLQIIFDEGILCIDAKFPLDNYDKYLESVDEKDKERYKRRFLTDLKYHLDKIKNNYIKPEIGTLDYAIAFIPVESVYNFIIQNYWDEIINYAKEGVIVASPIMMMELVRLLGVEVFRKKLPEKVREVLNEFNKIDRIYKEIQDTYKVLDRHLTNLINKNQELKQKFDDLRDEINHMIELIKQ